jgi:hypothetical protein
MGNSDDLNCLPHRKKYAITHTPAPDLLPTLGWECRAKTFDMNELIKTMIDRRMKDVRNRLRNGKEIKPEGFFFVSAGGRQSEIMIPGYIAGKWRQYSEKTPMELIAVILMTDTWMSKDPSQPSPRQDPKRQEAINFR